MTETVVDEKLFRFMSISENVHHIKLLSRDSLGIIFGLISNNLNMTLNLHFAGYLGNPSI